MGRDQRRRGHLDQPSRTRRLTRKGVHDEVVRIRNDARLVPRARRRRRLGRAASPAASKQRIAHRRQRTACCPARPTFVLTTLSRGGLRRTSDAGRTRDRREPSSSRRSGRGTRKVVVRTASRQEQKFKLVGRVDSASAEAASAQARTSTFRGSHQERTQLFGRCGGVCARLDADRQARLPARKGYLGRR